MSVAYAIDNKRFSSSAPQNRTLSLKSDWIEFLAPPVSIRVVDLHDEFSEYEMYAVEDWDGYGADPISIQTVQAARGFKRMLARETPEPDVAPGSDGTIGFEWRFGPPEERRFLLIDIGPADQVTARRIAEDGTVRASAPTSVDQGGRALIDQLFRE